MKPPVNKTPMRSNDMPRLQQESRKHRRRRVTRRGTAIVEFAFVAPVLLLVMFACIEFTRFQMMQALAEDAAYYAARHVVVPGATVEEAEQIALDLLSTLGTNGPIVAITPFAEAVQQQQIGADTTSVRIDIQIPVASNALFTPSFMTSGNIQKITTLQTERYSGYFDGTAVP